MPRRSELAAIGFYAPVIVAARMQTLALALFRPSVNGGSEAYRMSAEKPLAMLEGTIAAQRSVVESSVNFWQDVALAANALIFGAPATSMLAATVPARRRVSANARRLTGY